MMEGRANRFGGYRLQPEALHRLLNAAEFQQVTKDKLALAAGVAGVDQKIDILPLHQTLKQVEARLRLFDRLAVELVRYDRQVCEAPFAAFHIELTRQTELDQMPQSGRNDVTVTFKVIFHFLETAEGASQIAGHARLLRNDQSFGHEGWYRTLVSENCN